MPRQLHKLSEVFNYLNSVVGPSGPENIINVFTPQKPKSALKKHPGVKLPIKKRKYPRKSVKFTPNTNK